MNEAARTILNKLNLIDPTLSNFSPYQQSSEIRQLWTSAISSISSILTTLSNTSLDPIEISSKIISILSTYTLLFSVIHAIISTQIRMNKSDQSIENVLKKEIEKISHQIQVLKQYFNQSLFKVELAQEAIIHHLGVLLDLLITYCLSPSSGIRYRPRLQKARPFLHRRYSKGLFDSNLIDGTSNMIYNPLCNNIREKSNTDTVGKKFIRGIHSLKSYPAMTFLPNRPLSTKSEQPPRKKRIFFDKQGSEAYWNENRHFSENNSTKGESTTLRFIWNSQSWNESITKKTPKSIRDLFQASSNELITKRHDRASNFYEKIQSVTEETEMQDSLYSSSIMTETEFSTESDGNDSVDRQDLDKRHLMSPFSMKTNLHWPIEEEEGEGETVVDDDSNSESNDHDHSMQLANNSKHWRHHKTLYRVEPIVDEEEDDSESSSCCCEQTIVLLKRDNSRKRKSDGHLVLSATDSTIGSTEEHHQPRSSLLHLPTVENFLTIMNVSTSPNSSYYSAHLDSSSNISSQFTLNSILLDEVTNSLAATQIAEPSHVPDTSRESTNDQKKTTTAVISNKSSIESLPPPVPPKDHLSYVDVDRQPGISNLLLKRASTTKPSKKKTPSPDLRITTAVKNDATNTFVAPLMSPNDRQNRPTLPPPRRSSMPTTRPKPRLLQNPPLPTAAQEKAISTLIQEPAKPVYDESTWSSIFGLSKREDIQEVVAKRAKLGRSLGLIATTSKRNSNKKADSGQLSGAQILKMTENGKTVLIFEMSSGKFQVVAGTLDRLFEKLADETIQDIDYVDTFLINHTEYIGSEELLARLISRFHLGPSPGEYEYFKKWQYSIQTKVLNVIDRWIQIQYQHFNSDPNLERRLNAFLLDNDSLLTIQFKQQIEQVRYHLKDQSVQWSHPFPYQSLVTSSVPPPTPTSLNFYIPFISNIGQSTVTPMALGGSRRPSGMLFNLGSLTTPPESPSSHYFSQSIGASLHTSLSSFESKDIARYLTLADYYFFKIILSLGCLNTCHQHKHSSNDKDLQKGNHPDLNYIELMTKRSNMLSHWVVHELCQLTCLKPKRTLLKKFIDIAKLCLELNNFHTCMVIVMGLACAPKLQEAWDSLSTRDMNTYSSLYKLLDVSMNMRHYRQKIRSAKTPSIPFLPVVLKDRTFYNENATFLISDPHLINFSKFRSIGQFIEKIRVMMNEPYCFTTDLTQFPFFPQIRKEVANGGSGGGSLDSIGEWIEERLSTIQDCYLNCDLL